MNFLKKIALGWVQLKDIGSEWNYHMTKASDNENFEFWMMLNFDYVGFLNSQQS